MIKGRKSVNGKRLYILNYQDILAEPCFTKWDTLVRVSLIYQVMHWWQLKVDLWTLGHNRN
jgi:hypothetical protein